MIEGSLDEKDIINAVWNSVIQLFGEYGASQTNLSLIRYDAQRNYGVLRCSHGAIDVVRAAVASVTDINEKPSVIHVLGVSGTLKALGKKFSNLH